MPKFGVLSGSSERPEPKPIVRPTAPSLGLSPKNGAAAADETPQTYLGVPPSEGNAPITLPFIMACILVFMEIGRPFDQYLTGYHIPAVIGGIGILVTLFTDWASALRSKIGLPLIFFVVVMCATSLTSIWRGGSVSYVQQFVELNFVLFCLVCSAPKSVSQVRWLASMVILGIIFNIATGSGFDAGGRLYLTDETFGNSDDIGLMGGFAIPIVVIICSRMNKVLGIVLGAAGVFGCLLIIGLSATRFALVSLAVTALVYFFRTSGGQRLLLVAGLVITLAASIVLLPKSTVQRFGTLSQVFGGADEQAATNEAIGSLLERQRLSKDAFEAFITHPLFGVGPNNFTVWRWTTLGRHGQPAHNVYLQTAAEEGIVGAVLYTGFLLLCISTLQKCTKPEPGWEDGRSTALALQLAMIYFVVSGLFINCQMHAHQFLIAGLSVAMLRLRQEQEQRVQLASAAAAPADDDAKISQVQAPERVRVPNGRPVRQFSTPPAENASQPRYRFNRPVSLSSRKDRE